MGHWGSPNIIHKVDGVSGDMISIGDYIWFEQMQGGWNAWNPVWNIGCTQEKCSGLWSDPKQFQICDTNGYCGGTYLP